MTQQELLVRFARGGALVNPPGRPVPPPPPPPQTSRFPGDPGSGKVMTGTEEGGDGRDWLLTNTGTRMLLTHRYFTNNLFTSGTFWSRSSIQADHDNGYVSLASFKLAGDNSAINNAAAILSGTYDSNFQAEAIWAAGVRFPILAEFWHEPEDNWSNGTTFGDSVAANYRAITRHIISIFQANGATNVTWVSAIYQTPWSFSSGGEGKWGPWFKFHADWKGTASGSNGRPVASDFYSGSSAMIKVQGHDCYNPNIGGDTYHEFSGPMDTTFSKMKADGYTPLPFIVPEWGTSAGKSTTGVLKSMPSDGWTGFYKRAFQYMRDNNGVAFNIYTIGGTSFISGSDKTNRLNGLKAALGTESSYLVSARPW